MEKRAKKMPRKMYTILRKAECVYCSGKLDLAAAWLEAKDCPKNSVPHPARDVLVNTQQVKDTVSANAVVSPLAANVSNDFSASVIMPSRLTAH
jgi:CHAD domain-containing protein